MNNHLITRYGHGIYQTALLYRGSPTDHPFRGIGDATLAERVHIHSV